MSGATHTSRPRALSFASSSRTSRMLRTGLPPAECSRNSVPMLGVASKWAYERRSALPEGTSLSVTLATEALRLSMGAELGLGAATAIGAIVEIWIIWISPRRWIRFVNCYSDYSRSQLVLIYISASQRSQRSLVASRDLSPSLTIRRQSFPILPRAGGADRRGEHGLVSTLSACTHLTQPCRCVVHVADNAERTTGCARDCTDDEILCIGATDFSLIGIRITKVIE